MSIKLIDNLLIFNISSYQFCDKLFNNDQLNYANTWIFEKYYERKENLCNFIFENKIANCWIITMFW